MFGAAGAPLLFVLKRVAHNHRLQLLKRRFRPNRLIRSPRPLRLPPIKCHKVVEFLCKFTHSKTPFLNLAHTKKKNTQPVEECDRKIDVFIRRHFLRTCRCPLSCYLRALFAVPNGLSVAASITEIGNSTPTTNSRDTWMQGIARMCTTYLE